MDKVGVDGDVSCDLIPDIGGRFVKGRLSVGLFGVEGMRVVVDTFVVWVVKTSAMDVGGERKSGLEKVAFEIDGAWKPVHAPAPLDGDSCEGCGSEADEAGP